MRPAVARADLGTDTAAADQMFTQTVLSLAMRVAETVLTVGASANDVTLTALQITRAYGLRSVHVDVTYNSISVSYQSAHHAPISLIGVALAAGTSLGTYMARPLRDTLSVTVHRVRSHTHR
ncbi:MAG: threonine/serine exporter family protein [Antricoccus sp.]